MTDQNLFNDLAARIAAELTPEGGWTQTDGNLRFKTPDYYGATLTRGRFNEIELIVDSCRRVGTDNKLPTKTYEIARSNGRIDEKAFAAAIALAKQRAGIAAEYAAAEASRAEKIKQETDALRAAIEAANMPDGWQFLKPATDGRWQPVVASGRLVNNVLHIAHRESYSVTADQAAWLFAILGGKMTLRIDATMTPEQWLAVREALAKPESEVSNG